MTGRKTAKSYLESSQTRLKFWMLSKLFGTCLRHSPTHPAVQVMLVISLPKFIFHSAYCTRNYAEFPVFIARSHSVSIHEEIISAEHTREKGVKMEITEIALMVPCS